MWPNLKFLDFYPTVILGFSAVARGGVGGARTPPPPSNYGGNESTNKLEVLTDQCSAFDLDFFSVDNCTRSTWYVIRPSFFPDCTQCLAVIYNNTQ